MKQTIIILILLALFLSACVQPTATPDPYPGGGDPPIPTAYPGAVAFAHLASPTPAPARAQAVVNQDESLNLPVVIKDGLPAKPTATATATQPAPTPTNTAQPPTATATVAPPTRTPGTGNLPQFVNGGFEDGVAGWQWYSDVHNSLISDNIRFYDSIYLSMYTWRAFGGSDFAAWMGRIPYRTCPDCEPIVGINGIGERSLLAQQVEIPADIPQAYFSLQLLLRSSERACDVDRYPADQLRLYIGNSYNPSQPVTVDDVWIGFMGVCRDHTTIEYKPVTLPFNFALYGGQTKWFKLLVMNDLSGETHWLIDDVQFVDRPPLGIEAQSVGDPHWQPPDAYIGDEPAVPEW